MTASAAARRALRSPSAIWEDDGRSAWTALAVYWSLLIALDLIPMTSPIAMPVVALSAIGIMSWSILRHGVASLWWGVVGALVLFSARGAAQDVFHTLGNLTATRSLIPDALALPGYVLLGLTLVRIVGARTRDNGHRIEIIGDALIAGVALLAYCWVFVIERVLSGIDSPEPVRVVLVCYPALSLFLVVTTLQIAFSARKRPTSAERFFVLAMLSMFVGDALWMVAELHAQLHVGEPSTGILDLPYVVALAGAASMATRPSMRGLTEARHDTRDRWSVGRIALVAVAFTTPAVLLFEAGERSLAERLVLFVIVTVLTGLGILQILEALRASARSEARLHHLATHDSLTGLANRRLLEQSLGASVRRAERSGAMVGLVFLDLDRFKLINDTLGHAQGDTLLVEIASRLKAMLDPGVLVARTGGDEFLIVLEEPPSVEQALGLANRLRRAVSSPVDLSGGEFHVTASIGLACSVAGASATDAQTLIRDADTALYQAKEAGRDTVAVFDDSMRAGLAERVDLERDLRHAVEHGELHLVYQPVVRMATGEILGVEALVRWAHPTYGVILPSRFISIAEQSDVIIEMGSWVLNEALRQLAEIRKLPSFLHLQVAVNVSVAQLRDEVLVERISWALAKNDLPGSALCVELTESAMMRDPNAAIAMLEALRRLDVEIAVDDFGTEYSSLSYLHRLPVDVLKIDRSFVEGLKGGGGPAESLVSAIVAMAGALGIQTIAEGVETVEQAQRLRSIGCDAVQGYLYARPARGDQLANVLGLVTRSTFERSGVDQPVRIQLSR
jgi:diguanylate cyclase (GGDEF)-like protein